MYLPIYDIFTHNLLKTYLNLIVYRVLCVTVHETVDCRQCIECCMLTAVPDPPVSVMVRCNSVNRTAEIWWQPGKENYAPILNFLVQYNTTFQPDIWYDIATNISQNNRRIVVTLSPWGNYTFRVLSRNKIGTSLPSFQSRNVCRTEPGVPDTNPENVIGEGDRPGNLVIFWTVSHSLCRVIN